MPRLTQRAPRAAVTDVFEDLRPLVDRIAAAHAYKFRRDVEDIRDEAYFHFLEAYHGYDPGAGTSIEQRVQYVVKNRLLDRVRDEIEKNELLKRTGVDPDATAAPAPPPFDRAAFENRLGADARAVVQLLFDTPADLADAIRTDPNPGPASVRRCLWKHLRDVMGWTAAQVREAFDDISEVLS